MSNKHIMVYGGSFDPIHYGHMAVVDICCSSFPTAEVWIMPSLTEPGKQLESFEHRVNMIECMLDSYKDGAMANKDTLNAITSGRLRISPFSKNEETLTGTYSGSYVVLNKLKQRLSKIEDYKDVRITLVIGGDQLLGIRKWRNSRKLIREFDIFVVPREGYDIKDCLTEGMYGMTIVSTTTPSNSSTEIRSIISNNEVTKQSTHLKALFSRTHCSVIDYIEDNNLYKQRN